MYNWPTQPEPYEVLPYDLLHPVDESAIASEQDENDAD